MELQNTSTIKNCPKCGSKLLGDGITIPRFCSSLKGGTNRLNLARINYCQGDPNMYFTEFEYNGVKLTCKFDYNPAIPATMVSMEEFEEVELLEVLVRNVDIIEILPQSTIIELEQRILEIKNPS